MEIKEALEFLDRKANEIASLEELTYTNQGVILWRNSIEDVLEEVFGKDSTEYKRFHETRMKWPSKLTKVQRQKQYVRQLRNRRTQIRSIINKYKILGIKEKTEKKLAQKDTTESTLQLFDTMQLHPRIRRASKSLFNSGHYAEAIFAAFKAVNNFTKKKTGLAFDGKDLMAKTFNEDKPIIKLNKLSNQSERDEQEGFRFLFMGAMVGIRNPKAHEDIRQIDPYKTLEYLSFASLLMRRATEGKLEKEE